MGPFASSRSIAAQLCVVPAAFGLLAAWPRGDDPVLLIPLAGDARPAAMATTLGARIVGRGPVRGSIVVKPGTDPLTAAALRHGILALSASGTGCSAGQANG